MAASTSAIAARGGSSSDPTRRTAFVAGVLYLITFLSSIPAVFLLGPALTNPEYILGAGAEGPVRLGAFLDFVNVLALIGTAVALFSVVKRQHEGFALGFVTTRMLEAAVLSVGILTMLSMVTLRGTGTDDATMVSVGQSFVAVRDWSFIIGTGMAAANALMLGTLMYRSRLVPRVIPALGLIGVVTFGSWVIGNILGVAEAGTPWQAIGVAPIFVWELALGLWMAIKGFRAPAVAELYGATVPVDGAMNSVAGATAKAGAA